MNIGLYLLACGSIVTSLRYSVIYASRQAVCGLKKEVKMVLEMSPNLLRAPLAHHHDQPLLGHQVPHDLALKPPHWAV